MLDSFKKLLGIKKQLEPVLVIDNEVIQFQKEFFQDALDNKEGYSVKLATVPKYKELKSKSTAFKKEFLFALIIAKNGKSNLQWGNNAYTIREIATKTLSLLIRSSDLQFEDEEVLVIINQFVFGGDEKFYAWNWPVTPLISKIEEKVKSRGVSPDIDSALLILAKAIAKQTYPSAEDKRILIRIANIGKKQSEFAINLGDALGKSIEATVRSFEKKEQVAFTNLLEHFSKGLGQSTPTKAWLKVSKDYVDDIGAEGLVVNFTEWIDSVVNIFKHIHKKNEYEFDFVSDQNLQILRSAIWTSSLINSDDLNQSIEDLGLWSFKKLRGYGSVSTKLGNACIYTFSKLPYQDGTARLTKFRMKIKYPSVRKMIEKAIIKVANAEGKTMDEIEEMAVQDFGLNDSYQLKQNFGDYIALASIINSSTISIVWENVSGAQIKSVPKHVKDNFPEELKLLKKKIKDIQSNLVAQKSRIEKIFLGKRKWKFSQWQELYLENNLLAFFGKRLIWNFTIDKNTVSAIYYEGQFIDFNDVVKFDFENAEVSIWHPVEAEVVEVESWRNWLVDNEVKQPFKQAHRELYIVTDAEITTNSYSNRFAAHIIRQHIFIALCRERGWGYTLQGQWDSYNIPILKIPAWKYRAEFWVEGINDAANDMGVFNYLQTDQVRFYDEESQVNMADVPAIVFSEIMRDVDLFIGVTSIGADPNWRDGGEERFQGYWQSYSFGDLATSGIERKKLLTLIIPKLKIAKQCSFEGNFLVVKGELRIYKIHLGSGNILMKPNDQYLCIVADRSKSKEDVFLPFEGDTVLSIILSKAFMLAEDKGIKDRTIISQINR